jgi:hypothetical protein
MSTLTNGQRQVPSEALDRMGSLANKSVLHTRHSSSGKHQKL